MPLGGKKALITGSGRGIGRAIAIRSAREGADVIINDFVIAGEARQTLAKVEAAGRRGLWN
jgi:NAD(P)-dependent dehydrogenase (short-subunit alcohol dehydrogenase family)